MSLTLFKYLWGHFALFIFCGTAFAQIDTVYLRFDGDSKAVYLKENGVGEMIEVPVYYTTPDHDWGREFYIKGLLFRHENSGMRKTRISEESKFYPEKILEPEEVVQLIHTLQEKYPFGAKPSEDYPYLFIVFKKAGFPSILYEVKWRYYIE